MSHGRAVSLSGKRIKPSFSSHNQFGRPGWCFIFCASSLANDVTLAINMVGASGEGNGMGTHDFNNPTTRAP